MVIAVVLKVHMHCEACAQEIKKRILKMKGKLEKKMDPIIITRKFLARTVKKSTLHLII